jgi:hypothetical protein
MDTKDLHWQRNDACVFYTSLFDIRGNFFKPGRAQALPLNAAVPLL